MEERASQQSGAVGGVVEKAGPAYIVSGNAAQEAKVEISWRGGEGTATRV